MLASLLVELLAIVDPFDNGGTSSPWAMELPDKKRGLRLRRWPCRESARMGARGRFIKMQSLLSLSLSLAVPAETIEMVQSNLDTSLLQNFR